MQRFTLNLDGEPFLDGVVLRGGQVVLCDDLPGYVVYNTLADLKAAYQDSCEGTPAFVWWDQPPAGEQDSPYTTRPLEATAG